MSALIDAIGSPGKASVLSPLANKLVLKAATVGGLHQGIAGRPTFRAEILKTASESWWYWTFDERDPKKNVISTANLLNFGMQQRFASLGIMHSALTADLESGKSLSQLMDSLIEIQDKMLAAIQKEFMQHRRHLVRSFTNWIKIHPPSFTKGTDGSSSFGSSYLDYVESQTDLMGFFRLLKNSETEFYQFIKGESWDMFYLFPDGKEEEEEASWHKRSSPFSPKNEDQTVKSSSGCGQLDDGGKEKKRKEEEEEKLDQTIVKVIKFHFDYLPDCVVCLRQ